MDVVQGCCEAAAESVVVIFGVNVSLRDSARIERKERFAQDSLQVGHLRCSWSCCKSFTIMRSTGASPVVACPEIGVDELSRPGDDRHSV